MYFYLFGVQIQRPWWFSGLNSVHSFEVIVCGVAQTNHIRDDNVPRRRGNLAGCRVAI